MKFKPGEITELTTYLKPLLEQPEVQRMRAFMQHGNTDCLRHCVAVACWSYYLAKRLRVPVRVESLIRGAVLHDYFLYNWHQYKKAKVGGMHGTTHPKTALKNALQSFNLCPVERDIIEKHMWPVTIRPPRYREAWFVHQLISRRWRDTQDFCHCL